MIGKHWSEHMDNQDDNDQYDEMRTEINRLRAELAAQTALVEKCMVEMNENADKGEKAEAELARLKAQPVQPAPLTQTCKMCGYIGCDTDACGECPRCHWDELVPTEVSSLLSALNAMLTQFGMDEDEWNKPTFDQARAAVRTGGAG